MYDFAQAAQIVGRSGAATKANPGAGAAGGGGHASCTAEMCRLRFAELELGLQGGAKAQPSQPTQPTQPTQPAQAAQGGLSSASSATPAVKHQTVSPFVMPASKPVVERAPVTGTNLEELD
jgi:hypothetical protein